MTGYVYHGDSCFIPLRPNPNGSPTDPNHPTTMQPVFMGVLIPLLTIAGIAVGVRTAEALRKDRRLKIDDYACLVAFFIAIPSIAVGILFATSNRHDFDIPNCFPTELELLQCPSETRNSIVCFNSPYWLKLTTAGNVLNLTALVLGKVSLCALYLRLFDSVKWLGYTVWSVIILTVAVYLTSIILTGIYYFPHGSNEHWDVTLLFRELKMAPFALFNRCSRIFCDVLLVIVPLQPILKTTLPTPKKISTLAVFAVAIIVTVATVFGFFYQMIEVYPLYNAQKVVIDAGWKNGALTLLNYIEVCLVVIVSCVTDCVSAWRNVFRETAVYARLRSWTIRLRKLVGLPEEQSQPKTIPFNEAGFNPNLNFIESENDNIEQMRELHLA